MSSSKTKLAKNAFDERRQRRVTRHRVQFQVTLSHFLGDNYAKLEGHARNLSMSGIGILLAAELDSGEVVKLSFQIPALSAPWEVAAVVRYRNGYQYGLEFVSLSEEQQSQLEKFLKKNKAAD
jgi:c-di-GMP-binding flagellar brake protein YcgR